MIDEKPSWDTVPSVLNLLARKYNYQNYLEIGVDQSYTFQSVNVPIKQSVDIQAKCNPTFLMSSDQFFRDNCGLASYDLIFVDADHRMLPTLRAISDSLLHLNPNGTIVVHDIMPPNPKYMEPNYCSDAWKAWAILRMSRADLRMAVVPMWCGVGVIRRGKQKVFIPNEQSYFEYPPVSEEINSDFYWKYQDALLNMVDFDDLVEWLDSSQD